MTQPIYENPPNIIIPKNIRKDLQILLDQSEYCLDSSTQKALAFVIKTQRASTPELLEKECKCMINSLEDIPNDRCKEYYVLRDNLKLLLERGTRGCATRTRHVYPRQKCEDSYNSRTREL